MHASIGTHADDLRKFVDVRCRRLKEVLVSFVLGRAVTYCLGGGG